MLLSWCNNSLDLISKVKFPFTLDVQSFHTPLSFLEMNWSTWIWYPTYLQSVAFCGKTDWYPSSRKLVTNPLRCYITAGREFKPLDLKNDLYRHAITVLMWWNALTVQIQSLMNKLQHALSLHTSHVAKQDKHALTAIMMGILQSHCKNIICATDRPYCCRSGSWPLQKFLLNKYTYIWDTVVQGCLYGSRNSTKELDQKHGICTSENMPDHQNQPQNRSFLILA